MSKAQEEATVSVKSEAKPRKVTLALFKESEDKDPNYSARTEYYL